MQESLFLTRFASHVTMLIRRDRFSCPEALAKQVIKHENITVLFQCEAVRAEGNELVTKLWYRDQKSRTLHSVSSETGIGVFVFAGYEPETSFLKGQLPTDKNGYLLTDETGNLGFPLVYAAGDVQKKAGAPGDNCRRRRSGRRSSDDRGAGIMGAVEKTSSGKTPVFLL